MESERLERFQERLRADSIDSIDFAREQDQELTHRIRSLLNHPDIDKYCMVDAYFYDFSSIPETIKDLCCRDMYLLYGITNNGSIVSKWVERWDLDNDEFKFIKE